MPRLPQLPPAFHLVALDRELQAFGRAVASAPRGIDDGTVYWTERADRLELAILLEPEAPRADALAALYVLALAAGDALSTLLPRRLPRSAAAPLDSPVSFAWPCDLLLDGVRLGRLRCAVAPTADADEVPPWLVVGLSLEVAGTAGLGDGADEEPGGTSPAREEGGDTATTVRLSESVLRHFLVWLRRWREEGTAPLADAWNARCFRRGLESEVVLAGERLTGRVGGLDAAGAFAVGERHVGLGELLAEIG